MYRSIFIDLDDTVWAFTENARDTFQDMYDKYHFDRYFRSFSHFYTLYSGKNEELYKPQNKMFHFCKTFCSKITLVNTIQNVI